MLLVIVLKTLLGRSKRRKKENLLYIMLGVRIGVAAMRFPINMLTVSQQRIKFSVSTNYAAVGAYWPTGKNR